MVGAFFVLFIFMVIYALRTHVVFPLCARYANNMRELVHLEDSLNDAIGALHRDMKRWIDISTRRPRSSIIDRPQVWSERPQIMLKDHIDGITSWRWRRASVEDVKHYINECHMYMDMSILKNLWYYRNSIISSLDVSVQRPVRWNEAYGQLHGIEMDKWQHTIRWRPWY